MRDALPSLARRTLLMPFWLAQVLSQEKFFARNPVIGSRWLNEHGLHTARAEVAHLEMRPAATDVGVLAQRIAETAAPLAWRSNRWRWWPGRLPTRH